MVTISLCMIVKNEERVLGRCLESVQEIADEIITKSEVLKLKRWKEETDGSSDVIMLRYVTDFDEKRNPTLVYYRERIVKRDKNHQWQGQVHEAIAVRGRAAATVDVQFRPVPQVPQVP